MRRIACQIPDSVGRLISAGYLKSAPTWYGPVLANPPPVIAPRRLKLRPHLDGRGMPSTRYIQKGESKPSGFRPSNIAIQPIEYREDDIRVKFYEDFPFEAMRPTSLVELRGVEGEHRISGEAWTSLEQRGAFPTVEDTIQFVCKLHDVDGLSLSNAYKQATTEFVKLRGLYEMRLQAAETEALHFGAAFSMTAAERQFQKERVYLDAHLDTRRSQRASGATKARWKEPGTRRWTTYVHDAALRGEEYTGAKDYVERWGSTAMAIPAESEGSSSRRHEVDSDESTTERQEPMEDLAEKEREEMSDLDFIKAFREKTL